MTEEQVKKFLEESRYVDGGCSFCWSYVLRAFNVAFPGWESAIDKAWVDEGYTPGSWKDEMNEG